MSWVRRQVLWLKPTWARIWSSPSRCQIWWPTWTAPASRASSTSTSSRSKSLGSPRFFRPGNGDSRLLHQGLILRGLAQEALLAAQGLLEMVGKFKPLRFGSWGERAKRADNPVTRPRSVATDSTSR